MPDKRKKGNIVFELIASLLPITKMGRAMAAAIWVWFIHWVFVEGQTLFGSRSLKTILDFAAILGLIPLVYFIFRWARLLGGGMLWRLRSRLVVTYLLIGALPMLLVILLIALIGYTVVMQSSVNMVSRQLDGYLEQSKAAAVSIGKELSALDPAPADSEQLRSRLKESVNLLEPMLPDLTLSLLDLDSKGKVISLTGKASTEDRNRQPENQTLPLWLDGQKEFHGLVVDGRDERRRRVRAQHVLRMDKPRRMVLFLSYPISENICAKLRQTTGLEVKPSRAIRPLMLTESGPQLDRSEMNELGGMAEQAAWPAGSLPIYKRTLKWSTGKQMESDVLLINLSFLLPGNIWMRVQQFRSGSAFGNMIVIVIAVLGFLFMSLALVAIVSAVFLTTSVTRAVHWLYEGTKRVEAGDFDHEIPIKGDDQVAELSGSFNRMTSSVRELLTVSAEKQRLDQEVRIASQVQSRLFPRSVPDTVKLDIANGVCIPARTVSGDYFDYIEIDDHRIGFVVADVCGKGLSAALMMSNLQANLRSHVKAYHDAFKLTLAQGSQSASTGGSSAEMRPEAHPVREIVRNINQQVSDFMIDASYITLFYAEFDDRNSVLRYTNAGHNPPLLVRKGRDRETQFERLETGGTVLGIFHDIEYEEAEIELQADDLLVAFTDGLIEAHDQDNEEFGEDRLIETIASCIDYSAEDIQDRLLHAVREWTSDSEQEDDLTLIVFKVKQ